MSFFPTVKNFIKTALAPVGHTMYVYGGGWNESDTGASKEARTLGLSKRWREFSDLQDSHYNYRDFLYQNSDGLDCTGYIGWVIYNLLQDDNGRAGFVFKSSQLGHELHKLGLGSVESAPCTKRRCGDIFFSAVHCHAYICLGECSDKSVVLLHSSPPGVIVSGTKSPLDDENSVAEKTATEFMSKNFPSWHERFPVYTRDLSYITDYDRFRFYNVILPDPEGITRLDPCEILWSLI